jgi:hypothetical protein
MLYTILSKNSAAHGERQDRFLGGRAGVEHELATAGRKAVKISMPDFHLAPVE